MCDVYAGTRLENVAHWNMLLHTLLELIVTIGMTRYPLTLIRRQGRRQDVTKIVVKHHFHL